MLQSRLARFRVPLGFAAPRWAWPRAADTPVAPIGGVVAVVGETVRVWASGHIEKGREVTRSGPYRFVRHPLYLGSAIIGVGFMIAARNVWVVVLVTAYLATTLLAAMRSEEAALDAKFSGEYSAYRDGRAEPVDRPFSLAAPQRKSRVSSDRRTGDWGWDCCTCAVFYSPESGVQRPEFTDPIELCPDWVPRVSAPPAGGASALTGEGHFDHTLAVEFADGPVRAGPFERQRHLERQDDHFAGVGHGGIALADVLHASPGRITPTRQVTWPGPPVFQRPMANVSCTVGGASARQPPIPVVMCRRSVGRSGSYSWTNIAKATVSRGVSDMEAREIGGADGTRTRDLWRDRPAF